MNTFKRTRNTDLFKAAGYGMDRPYWDDFLSRNPGRRATHITDAFRHHSPLRTRSFNGGIAGWGSFQITADDRSYTVIVLADSPEEWWEVSADQLKQFVRTHMNRVDEHFSILRCKIAQRSRLADQVNTSG